jgi:hypothetical protein
VCESGTGQQVAQLHDSYMMMMIMMMIITTMPIFLEFALNMSHIENIYPMYLLRSVSYDSSTASSKASFKESTIWCTLFQFPLSSRFLKIVQ